MVKVQQELKEAGVGGPLFVTIGDAEKLDTFLETNPWMDRGRIFVDDYSFGAYKAAGFTRFDQVDKKKVKDFKLSNPGLGLNEWMKYFNIVGKVSPIPKNMKFGELPEGVLWTGGTFVVEGDDVIYQWTDTIPGNHPVIGDVVEIAKNAALKMKTKPKGTLIGRFMT